MVINFTTSIYSPIILKGHLFLGLSGLKRHVEKWAFIENPEDCYSRKRAIPFRTVHVGELCENFPCFDSADYLTEDRCFSNYIVRRRPVTKEDMIDVKKCCTGMNACCVSSRTPHKIAPIVYYPGEGSKMFVSIRLFNGWREK